MSEYVRHTRACQFHQLTPALAAALRAHAEQQQLGDLAASALFCAETTARKPKKGLFGKEEVLETAVIVTPQWLVWAAGQPGQSAVTRSARLRTITVQDYEKSPLYKLQPDTGLNITGLPTDDHSAGTAYLGLGPEPAAAEFRAALAKAQAAA